MDGYLPWLRDAIILLKSLFFCPHWTELFTPCCNVKAKMILQHKNITNTCLCVWPPFGPMQTRSRRSIFVFLQIKDQATSGFQAFIVHYRDDPDQQNLIDWIQERWVRLLKDFCKLATPCANHWSASKIISKVCHCWQNWSSKLKRKWDIYLQL